MIDFECLTLAQIEEDKQWWLIYRQSFPISQREPRKMILTSIELGEAFAIRIQENKKTIGMGLIYIANSPPHIFLDYIAVRTSHRRKKLGTQLFLFLIKVGKDKLKERGKKATAVFWETENISKNNSEIKNLRILRSLNFFKKMGGTIIPIEYLQPPVHPGKEQIELLLMFKPLGSIRNFDRRFLLKVLHSIYFDGYEIIEGVRPSLIKKTFLKMVKNITLTKLVVPIQQKAK